MALVDRIFRDDPSTAIPGHDFEAALWFFAKGEITRAQIVAAFGLTPTDEVQLDELIAHYQGLNPGDKAEFYSTLSAANVLAVGGYITKTQYKNLLGMT